MLEHLGVEVPMGIAGLAGEFAPRVKQPSVAPQLLFLFLCTNAIKSLLFASYYRMSAIFT